MTADPPVAQDPEFERRIAAWQRVGWWGMVAVVVAAAFGLFGTGLLNGVSRDAPSADLTVRYPRFWRQESPMVLTLVMRGAALRSGEAEFRISEGYLEDVRIASILPAPIREESSAEGVAFTIGVAPDASEARVQVQLQAESYGVLEGEIETRTGGTVRLKQFIHP